LWQNGRLYLEAVWGVVSGVGREMDVFDGSRDRRRGRGSIVGIYQGHPAVSNGDFVA